MALSREGRVAEALARCRKVLNKEPANFHACLMAGILRLQTGDSAGGIALLKRATVLNPNSFEARYNLGIALRASGQYDEALAQLDRTIALDGTLAAVHVNRAAALQALGRREEAIAGYETALALEPTNLEAWYQRGLALHALGRDQDAIVSYDRVLQVTDDAEVHYNRGVSLQALGRREEALSAYDRALSLHPDFPAALNNRGNLLLDLGRADEAQQSLDRCVALNPAFPEAYNNLGLALTALGRHGEALASLDRALALDPAYVDAHLNRGASLLALGRPDDALDGLIQAERLAPADPKVHHNFGIVLHALNRLDEALARYRKAIDLQPGYAEARFHMSLTQLLKGDFASGWQGYEFRWAIRNAAPRRLEGPLWHGSRPVAGQRIALWCEQGLGDAIQFCRYAPLLTNLGAKVILEIPAELKSLAGTLPGVDTLVVQGEPLPAFDVHCPLLTLPLALSTDLETIPGAVPYLSAEPGKVASWRSRIAAEGGLRIGIVATGNLKHSNDRNRSLTLESFSPLMRDGINLYLLQKECRPVDEDFLRANPAIRDLRPWLMDLSDTAAAIECLDLVISVDTAVAHLAGALGKPVWILLPYNPDWRWLMDRPDSPWYPTARLFRQPALGNWPVVIRDVSEALGILPAPPETSP